MPDQYTETTTRGLGSRLGSSIGGVFLGLIFFIVSFGLLYYNEGRQIHTAKLIEMAKQSQEMSAASPDASAQGKLVTACGILTTGDMLSDKVEWTSVSGTHLSAELKTRKLLKLSRHVEMFAWKETEESKTKKNLGGSETEEKTYTYKQVWTNAPEDSSEFKVPEEHKNPVLTLDQVDAVVDHASLGTLTIDPSKFEFPPEQKFILSKDTVTYTDENLASAGSPEYIFFGTGSLASPRIGDLRVSYTYLPSDLNIVAFGKLNGTNLSPYVNEKDGALYRGFLGTKDEAVATMTSENSLTTWLLRLLGFVLMWLGLSMLLAPISTLLDILPMLGSVSRGLIGFVTFVVAFVLSILTILISMLVHNVIALIVVAVAGTIIAIFVIKHALKKPKMA